MIPALPCGTFSDSDTPAGAFYVAAFEDGDQVLCIEHFSEWWNAQKEVQT